MTHPQEGMLLALRDGEGIPETARAHIAACSVCRGVLAEARVRAGSIRDLLDREVELVDTEAAKAEVRARLDQARARPRYPRIMTSLGRAAAILLLAAGAAYAVQSPQVRGWFSDRFVQPGVSEAPAVDAPVQSDELRSIGVAARPGLVVALTELGVETRIALVFEVRDEVEVFAGEDTRFAVADNRITVSDVIGPVVIRVPAGAPTLTVTANGRTMFMGTEATYEIDGSGVRADGGWVFRVPDF